MYQPKTFPENWRAPEERVRSQKERRRITWDTEARSWVLAWVRLDLRSDWGCSDEMRIGSLTETRGVMDILRGGSRMRRRVKTATTTPTTPIAFNASFQGVPVLSKAVAICPETASPT